MDNDVAVSVLLPTRGRTTALKSSLASLYQNMCRPQHVEYMLAFDEDDADSLSYFQDEIAHEIDQAGSSYTVMQFEPLGYLRLNQYVNTLAGASQGRWLMFWNDDAVMKTQHWDLKITAHDGNFCVQRMPTHNQHPYAIFPIVPRAWYDLFGYISAHQISDAWVSQIAYMLDIMTDVDIEVVHDRHDLTGNNHDDTFKNRIMLEGNNTNPADFNHLSWRKRRAQDAGRIAEYCESQGQRMQWWRDVVDGRQDPWARMLSPECDPNRQVAQWR